MVVVCFKWKWKIPVFALKQVTNPQMPSATHLSGMACRKPCSWHRILETWAAGTTVLRQHLKRVAVEVLQKVCVCVYVCIYIYVYTIDTWCICIYTYTYTCMYIYIPYTCMPGQMCCLGQASALWDSRCRPSTPTADENCPHHRHHHHQTWDLKYALKVNVYKTR